MASAVAELEAGLQAMLALKPPGVSGSRITSLTTLCNSNVQSESVLVQKLYTHFKKAPGTHKLGVLYVVDSVARKWTEQAKHAGQAINGDAKDGTFAAGVNRVKELLPVLMSDIITNAPDDHKEKIKKLLDIWEKGQTFPSSMLTQFKEKLDTALQNQSTTPQGTPPPNVQQTSTALPSSQQPNTTSSAPNTLSVLETLANMARQNAAAPTPNPAPTAASAFGSASAMPVQHGGQAAPSMPSSMGFPAPTSGQAASFASLMPPPTLGSGPQGLTANPNSLQSSGALDPTIQNQLLWIKLLSDQGVPADKIAAIIAGMPGMGATPPGAAANPNQGGQNYAQAATPVYNANASLANPAQNAWQPPHAISRDRSSYHDVEGLRSPGGTRRRSRSPSPRRSWDERGVLKTTVPNRNNRDSPDRGRGRDQGETYRQRSPARRVSPDTHKGAVAGAKWIGRDDTLPYGSIKVLSRTLFVGGVNMPEEELRRIFSRYGAVQTVIMNKEKRHAFVKMFTRDEALSARDNMESNRDSQLRTRWGVGFGPRECSDYQTGISIIPIDRLTDADRKWMLTAEYGGTGGKTIESGMVVEEPDIEIGQGVSSKAISKRRQSDKSGPTGPLSDRWDRHNGAGDDDYRPRRERERLDDRRDNRRDDQRNDRGRDRPSTTSLTTPVATPTNMPGFQFPAGFPYNLPMQNGVPMFPPGFVFPGQSTMQQPPAPGR